jgi:hypothetical protein
LLQSIDEPTLASESIAELITEGEVAEIAGVGDKERLICSLQRAASLHARRAARSTFLWTRLVPRLATIVVGGGMIMTYAWLVIAPVYRQVAQW